jgi:hypothetical protein
MTDENVVQLRQPRTVYTPELARVVVAEIRAGAGVESLSIPVRAFHRWMKARPEFREAVAEARRSRLAEGHRKPVTVAQGPPTDQQALTLLDAISEGCTRVHAAALAGAGTRTLDMWLEDEEFELRVLRAEAACQREALARVKEGGRDWTAFGWLLERRFPDYAKRFEITAAERAKQAMKMGTVLAETLVAALAEAGLSSEQQETIRKKVSEALERVIAG